MTLPNTFRLVLAAFAAAAAVTTVAAAPERAEAARILTSTFVCQPNLGLLGIEAPQLADQQGRYVWWYPIVYRQTATGYQLAATPGWFYRQASDAMWTKYPEGTRHYDVILHPGPGRFVVVNWVWDGGWAYLVAESAYARGYGICQLG